MVLFCLTEVECCDVWSGLDEVGYHQELFSMSKVRVWFGRGDGKCGLVKRRFSQVQSGCGLACCGSTVRLSYALLCIGNAEPSFVL